MDKFLEKYNFPFNFCVKILLAFMNIYSNLPIYLYICTAFDPQLKITPVTGKTAPADDPILTQIRQLPQVDVATESLEDNALAMYRDKQAMVVIKGVDDNFAELTHITEILYGDGEFELQAANLQYGVLGLRLAAELATGARWNDYLKIYAPKREGQLDMANPEEAFVEDSLLSPGVIFSVKQAISPLTSRLLSHTMCRRP